MSTTRLGPTGTPTREYGQKTTEPSEPSDGSENPPPEAENGKSGIRKKTGIGPN